MFKKFTQSAGRFLMGALGIVLVLVVAVVAAVVAIVAAPHRGTPAAASVRVSVPSATTAALPPLSASVIQIESTWEGEVSAPFMNGSIGIPVSTTSYCTAWFVQGNPHPVLVTSAHCLNDRDVTERLKADAYDNLPQTGRFPLSPDDLGVSGDNVAPVSNDIKIKPTYDSLMTFGKRPTGLTLIATQEPDEGDIAILQAGASLPGIRPLTVAPRDPSVGASVISVGYPGSITENVTEEYLESTQTRGWVTSRQIDKDGIPVIGVSSPLGHGMSGGPTVDARHRVIGLNRAVTDMQPLNIVTDTETLREFLAENGITPGTPGNDRLTGSFMFGK